MRFALPLLLAGVADVAQALPDLIPEVDDVQVVTGQTVGAGDVAEGCAAATGGRTLVRFGVRFWNRGTDPLIIGAPGCPDCEQDPGAVCEDPRFMCSPADGHGHPHFDGFAAYELLDPAGSLVATGLKASFCIRENGCADGPPSGDFSCEELQGIGVDCYDYYRNSLGCQYIDVTDVPNATKRAFRIRVTLDPDTQLPDADRSNNSTEFAIAGCGDGHRDAGEQCDAGTSADQPCCGSDCRFLAAGTTCRAASGACDVTETCKGNAASCPTDRAAEDGTPCGPGIPPCLAERCEAGACTADLAADFCVIDAACVPGDALDDSGCRSCQPAVRTDGWTDTSTPDAPGLRCQLERVTAALANGCTAKTRRQMERRVARLDVLLRLVTLHGRAGARTRLAGRTRKLDLYAVRHGCATAEVAAFVAQTDAFLAALAPA